MSRHSLVTLSAFHDVLVCSFLLFLALAAYGGLCGADAVFCDLDDPQYVTANPQVQAGLTAESVRWAFTTFYASNWHPLTWLSLQLDHELFGSGAWGYHLTNVLLHAANAILLFLWLRQATSARWPSAFVAALFLIHPLHVESVAWVTERKDVLSTLFWMLTITFYVSYARCPGLGRYLLVFVSMALGLMAKPMLVSLPCVLLLLDWWPLQHGRVREWESESARTLSPSHSLTRLLIEKVPLLALSLAAGVVTLLAQQNSAMQSLEHLPLSARLANAAISYWRYIGKSFWPTDLSIMYLQPPEGWPWWGAAAAAVGILGATSFMLSSTGRRHPYLAVGWLWFLVTLAPVIGVVQVGIQAMADRYTYVPLIGLFILLTWGITDLWARWRLPQVLLPLGATLVLLVALVFTWNQVRLWQDPVAFWQHAAQVEPNYYAAYNTAGEHLLLQGKPEEAIPYLHEAAKYAPNAASTRYKLGLAYFQLQRWEEAVRHLTVAVNINPSDSQTHMMLGHCGLAQFQLADAVRHFQTASKLEPNSAQTQSQLGTALLYQGDRQEARRHLNDALRLDSASGYARTQLGLLDLLEGSHEKGQANLRQALEAAPNNVAANFYLGWSLQATGQSDEAGRQYQQVRELAPQWPQTAAQFAWSLATQPQAGDRNGALALLHAEAACQAVEAPAVEMLDALAAAQAETGHYTEAVATIRRALAQSPEESSKRGVLEKRLALYQSGRPFRAGK